MSDHWEYKTIDFRAQTTFNGKVDVGTLETQLNELGRVGWELVSALPNSHCGQSRGSVVILKRRR